MNPLCPDGEIRSDKANTQRRATFLVSPFSSRPPGIREGSLSPWPHAFSLSFLFPLLARSPGNLGSPERPSCSAPSYRAPRLSSKSHFPLVLVAGRPSRACAVACVCRNLATCSRAPAIITPVAFDRVDRAFSTWISTFSSLRAFQ